MHMDHILIIENDTQLLQQYTFAFEQVAMKTTGARNADEALHVVNQHGGKQHPIDIILISMQLEGKSAVECIATLRNRGNPVPVVALSTYGTKAMLVKLMQLHCSDFIETPITFGLLYTRIHSALQKYRNLFNKVNNHLRD